MTRREQRERKERNLAREQLDNTLRVRVGDSLLKSIQALAAGRKIDESDICRLAFTEFIARNKKFLSESSKTPHCNL